MAPPEINLPRPVQHKEKTRLYSIKPSQRAMVERAPGHGNSMRGICEPILGIVTLVNNQVERSVRPGPKSGTDGILL